MSKITKDLSKQSNNKISDIFENIDSISFFCILVTIIKVMKLIVKLLLNTEIRQKLLKLSDLRSESFHDTFLHITNTGFQLIPKNIDALDAPTIKKDIVSSVAKVDSETFLIKTSDGMTFYDWAGSRKHAQLYWLMRDQSHKFYTPETYFAGGAVQRSYVYGTCRLPGDQYLPREGGIIIEAGSYVGYKAVSFAKRVGPSGRIGVIEASTHNFNLLVRNIESNKLEKNADAVNCAVWNENTYLQLKSKNRMQYTVAATDELKYTKFDNITARTLDYLIDYWGFDRIDFLNLQLNGAEIEAIQGLQKNFHKVRYINIITRYRREGELVVDIVKRLLLERGCTILVDARTENLYNLTAKVHNK